MRGLAPLLLLATIGLAARPAAASHTLEFWWRPGPYGTETVSLFVMDALPSGGQEGDPNYRTSPRTVVLDFDVEASGTWTDNLFEVHANGDPLLQEPLSPLPGQPFTYSFTLTFPLYYVFQCCTDILVTFAKTGPVTDGLWSL